MLINRHLGTKLRTHSIRVIAQGIALGALGGEHQEPIVRHVEPELLVDVPVVGGRLVAGAAGAVEPRPGVDARRGDVAVVLARERVAGAALWPLVRRRRHGGGREERGEEDGDGLHFVGVHW